jgi:hypothetical protein
MLSSIASESIQIPAFVFIKIPVIFGQFLIILGVNDGKFIFRKVNSPKCAAIAPFSAAQNEP